MLQKIFFILTFFFSPVVNAQLTNQLYFKHLTPNDGLTQSVIADIYTDSKGFVWMTGRDGINRFDGSHCLANNEIAPGLHNPGNTTKVVEDKNGDIWFGYSYGLIQYSYHNNRFSEHKLFEVVPGRNHRNAETYFPIACDNENNVMIGGFPNKVMVYNIVTKQHRYYAAPQENISAHLGLYFPPKLRSLKKEWKWLLRSNDSIFVFTLTGSGNGDEWQRQSFAFTHDVVETFWLTDNNTLFFYDNMRIFKYRFSDRQLSSSQAIANYGGRLSFIADPTGNLWLSGIKNGLLVLDTATLKIRSHIKYDSRNSNGISTDNVNAYIDQHQMIWAQAWGKGIDYANLMEERFTSLITADEAKAAGFSNFIRGITEGPGADFFCSTQSGIIQLDKNLRFRKIITGAANFQYPDIILHQEKLYYASDDKLPGLYQYDLRSGTIKKFSVNTKEYKGPVHVYHLSKTANNDLLLSCVQGLWKFNVVKQKIECIKELTLYPEYAGTTVYSYEDKQQQVYKCLNNLGFVVFRKNNDAYKTVFTFGESSTVKHIVPDSDSLLWIGTTNGLYLFNIRQLKMAKHFTTENGLPNNIVYAIAKDEKNNLWLGTNKGLSYLNVTKEIFVNFTNDDGLQANEFNSHAVIHTKDGRIIFGGVNGLTVVNPAVLAYKTQHPLLHITAIKADSILNPYPYNEKNASIILQPGTSSFEIEFTAINFNNPGLCKIKYRLKGFDDTWQYTANTGIARYIKLPAGKYVLEAMASNTRGEFGAEIKQLTVLVKAYWWQTTRFKIISVILLVLLIASGIAIYLRYKLNRQKRELEKQFAIQTERERITADLHDDVGATLSSMHIYGDLAHSVWDTKPQQSKEMVGKISSQSKELMARMSDIVWSLKPAGEEKNALTVRLKNYTQDLLAGKGITAHFNIDETIASAIINPIARKNILLIAKEAINNIAKYSEAKQATFILNQENENIQLIISDDGKGYDKDNTKAGNGISNMGQRCKQLNGSCVITAAPEKGVTITCVFPLAIISHSS